MKKYLVFFLSVIISTSCTKERAKNQAELNDADSIDVVYANQDSVIYDDFDDVLDYYNQILLNIWEKNVSPKERIPWNWDVEKFPSISKDSAMAIADSAINNQVLLQL